MKIEILSPTIIVLVTDKLVLQIYEFYLFIIFDYANVSDNRIFEMDYPVYYPFLKKKDRIMLIS